MERERREWRPDYQSCDHLDRIDRHCSWQLFQLVFEKRKKNDFNAHMLCSKAYSSSSTPPL